MSPRAISELVLREPTALNATDTIEHAVSSLLDTGLPALPVVDNDERFVGVFGEREFMTALFPGYLNQLRGAAFLRRSLDETLEKRDSCRAEHVEDYMTTEHVEVRPDFADTQVAEIFLHHRVLIVPVVDRGHVVGIVTRGDFFRALAERFLGDKSQDLG